MKPTEKTQVEEREVATDSPHKTATKFHQPKANAAPPGGWV